MPQLYRLDRLGGNKRNEPQLLKEELTAKRELEYTHGGKGDIRIRIINGKPLAFYLTS